MLLNIKGRRLHSPLHCHEYYLPLGSSLNVLDLADCKHAPASISMNLQVELNFVQSSAKIRTTTSDGRKAVHKTDVNDWAREYQTWSGSRAEKQRNWLVEMYNS